MIEETLPKNNGESMSTTNTIIQALGLLTFFCYLTTVSTVHAADPFVCDLYAEKAVAQSKANKAYSCSGSYPRFQDNKQAHYSWCLGAFSEAVAYENRARVVGLSDCKASQWNREADAYCTSYAQIALIQSSKANNQYCGFGGPRWQNNLTIHYNWCMRTEGRRPEAEMNARREGLKSCTGGSVVYPNYSPAVSGDLAVVDWCWEDVAGDTLFNAIVRNVGSNIWMSTLDAVLKVGTSRPGNITETQRHTPFIELWGLTQGKTRIIRGASLKYITPASYPTAEALLVHNHDHNLSNQSFRINFGTQGVIDFYTKYKHKRCDPFKHY